MIQVLLLILKIIGIMILSVLGLILLVLALILFVPVFYRIRVIHNPEKTQVKARISFLFPLLLVTVQYLKKLSYKLRVFGIALLDSDKPKKVKNKKAKKPKNKKKRKEKNPVTPEPVPETVAEPVASVETQATEQEAASPSVTEPIAENSKPKQEQKKEKKNILEKIKGKIQKIRETISNIIKKIKKLLHQKEEVQRILAKPETKQALKFAWDKLKRLLKQVLPRKIKGYVAYGADNPATTGQVLGILSIVYAKTGQLLTIRPNFEEKQLECDVELKGHIQVFTLLVIAIKVFFNKELRKTIAEFKNVKEVEE